MHYLAQHKKFDLVFGSRYEKNAASEDDTIITLIGNKIFIFRKNFFFADFNILYTFVLGDTEKVNLNLMKNDFSLC